jgi:oligoribonuclease (3'-5' exoribonuclease)
MTDIAFLDLETTGLEADRNELWEAGVVLVDPAQPDVIKLKATWQVGTKHLDMGRAEPTALRIGNFYSRHVDFSMDAFTETKSHHPITLAAELAVLLDGCIIAGNVIDFDSRFLTAFLRENNQQPTYHYHLLDVETYAAGILGLDPPWKGTIISDKLGIKQPDVAHTALGDAEWSYRIWLAARDRQGEQQELIESLIDAKKLES